MKIQTVESLKMQLAGQAKKGIDFIVAATFLWVLIACIWTLHITPYSKAVLSIATGGIMLPLAALLSKLFRTNWKIKDNPLQALGLWLNLAQLCYFPILVFLMLKQPEHFIMAYAIITSAHHFPFAWLYKEKAYAITACALSLTTLMLTLNIPDSLLYTIPLTTAAGLFILAVTLFITGEKTAVQP